MSTSPRSSTPSSRCCRRQRSPDSRPRTVPSSRRCRRRSGARCSRRRTPHSTAARPDNWPSARPATYSNRMTEASTPEFEVALAVFNGQAFTALIGASLRAFGDGVAVIEVPHRAELLQQHGFLHGGVIAYAIDNALTFAAGTVLGTSILT